LCLAVLSLSIASTSAQEIVVRPKPAAGPLDNPLKGWCPYTNAGPIRQPYSLVFQYISWKDLEPAENDFQFDEWEQSWNVEAAKDRHVIFRVFIDYPSQPSGLPDWLRKAGVKETAYQDYGGGLSPDYNNPRMIIAMENLIAALGKRYNTDPRIAFVQVGLLGFWGEWHTYPQPSLYATPETERRILDAYRKAFPDKRIMVRYARDYAAQQNWIGFHDDMFPDDTDNGKDWSFLAGLRRSQRDENWKSAVVGGEMEPGAAKKWMESEFQTTRTMLERSHFTWIGPYCPAIDASRDPVFLKHSEELVRKMGYEFQITELRHPRQVTVGKPVPMTLKGKNTGVAPFYYPWSVEWALLDQKGTLAARQSVAWDIRTWLPGDFHNEAQLHWNVVPGKYRLALGIRDPWKDRPAIRFANEAPVKDGWTILSEIQITE
jgi:hypothetical protein